MPKTKLSENEQLEWERDIQLACLKGLARQDLDINDIAFHGGTSLRFSWGSPRFSEDLDFMLTKSKMNDLDDIVEKTINWMTKEIEALDPEFNVKVKSKPRRDGQLQTFMVSVDKKNVLGSAKVKIEFWAVEDDFFQKYKTTFKVPTDKVAESRIYSQSPLPVAELQSAYCDKLVALSTRPYLKWRDIFDIWWLRSQNDINPLKDDPAFMSFFQHNLSAYSVPEGMTLRQSLERYVFWDQQEILEKSKEDLEKWLPPDLWKKFYPKVVEEMIAMVENDVKDLLAKLENTLEKKVAP